MLVNKEANYHVKREKGGVIFPVKAPPPIVMPTASYRDSKETKEKNQLSTMMSSDLENIMVLDFPQAKQMLDPKKLQTKSKTQTTRATKTTKNSLSPTAMSSDSFCVAWIHKKSKDKMKDLPRMCGFQATTISTSNKKG